MPEGMGSRGPQKPVDTTQLYKDLGIAKTASPADIRKAYTKLARENHPDKGGDPAVFQRISNAYEVLKDDEKRRVYDEHGLEAVTQGGGGGGGGGDASSIFEQMFGGGGGGGGGRRGGGGGRRKGEDIVHALNVTLEDLYNGKTSKLKVTRDVLCTGCTGTGCIAGASEIVCDECSGRGMRVTIVQRGPMIQQMQSPCGKCRGQGRSIKAADQCRTCLGKKTAEEKKVLEVHVEKGMKAGDRITFAGQSDEAPGMEPGDIIFAIQEAEHSVFKRQGCDLVIKKELSLKEALTGTRFSVTHLDGKKYTVIIPAGEMIAPDDVRAVVGKGMPVKGNPFVRGDLFIKFDVKFPKKGSLSPALLAELASVLPGPEAAPAAASASAAAADDVDAEEAIPVTEIDVEAARERARLMRAEDSDEEDGHPRGAQRVQCAQQ